MNRLPILAAVTIITCIVTIAGCMDDGSSGTQTQRSKVTPCNIITQNIEIKIDGNTLNTETIKGPLSLSFVDDFNGPSKDVLSSKYLVECYWAKNIGERKDLYYCTGSYQAPDVDDRNIIKRYLDKNFKIGFAVEKHEGGTWVDYEGKSRTEQPFSVLTVREITATCWTTVKS
ncbi:Uncharacterised protein [uncultured archaeon]|nr:Uncharacterised protein [uncultured archaeon]